MSDEDALLAAIAAHPEEDTPRLMYADWLDENGQSLRTEFIRVQIEVSRIEQLPRIELNGYVELFQRNHHLIEGHRGSCSARSRGCRWTCASSSTAVFPHSSN